MDDKRIYEIAKGIIAAIVLIGAGYAVLTGNAAQNVLVPLVTLIIGYYFGVGQPTPGTEVVTRISKDPPN